MKTAPPPLPVARTHGSRIVLADGRELIDGIASWWTACHGYNHPHIRAAVERQLATMPHVMFGGLVHEPALTLARRLAALLPGDLDRVFFSESGSVAVEVALKMAVQYLAQPRRCAAARRFVAFHGGYHGDTTGAMAVCDPDEGMHALFRGLLPAAHHRSICRATRRASPRFERLLERHADEIAGIIVEPLVQGAGGMRFHDAAVLRRLRAVADRYELLLIFDEIFTGFGRTGTMFACEAAGVVPDIITLSKALTGGTLPLAATIATQQGVRRVLVGRSGACADARPDLHGAMRSPAPPPMPRSICSSASRGLQQVAEISAALARGLEPCRGCPASRTCACKGAIGVVELDRIDDVDALAGALRGGGRVHPAVRLDRLSHAGLHDRAGRARDA